MGLVLNPTGYRIGYTRYWFDSWYSHRMHYPVFVHKSLEMKLLLEYVLRRRKFIKSLWIYSHITYYYFNNKFFINVFLYDGISYINYYYLTKKLKWRWYRNLKFVNRFTKKYLLDQMFYYQRWWLLCQVFNFDLEQLMFDDVKWRIKSRHWKKILGLKKRYGKYWKSREELLYKKNIISMSAFDSYNRMGMTYLNKIFRKYIQRDLKLNLNLSGNKMLPGGYNEKNFSRAHYVLTSYRKLYMFFSYFDKLFKIIPTYPSKIFNKSAYKIHFKFFRMYFIFRPYWYQVSKFYEILFLYININSKINIYLLDNPHLSAQFLAHYIMTSLRFRFDYRDTMIPIRKTLHRILFIRQWAKPNHIKEYMWNVAISRFNTFFEDRIGLYKDLFYLSSNNLYKHKLSKYLRKVKFFKIKNINYGKLRRFKKFNISIFKKNLFTFKEKIFNVDFLFKKNKFKLRKKPINNFLLIYNKKYLANLLKFNILFRFSKSNFLLLNNNKLSFFFIRFKKIVKLSRKKYAYSMRFALKSYYNYKAKLSVIRRKLRRLFIRLRKLSKFKIKKLFLIRSLLICFYFLLKRKRFLFSFFNKNSVKPVFLNFYVNFLKYRTVFKIFLKQKKLLKYAKRIEFYKEHHIRSKKHYQYFWPYDDNKLSHKYLLEKLRINKVLKKFFYFKRNIIKSKYLIGKNFKKTIILKNYNSFFVLMYFDNFFYSLINYFNYMYDLYMFFFQNFVFFKNKILRVYRSLFVYCKIKLIKKKYIQSLQTVKKVKIYKRVKRGFFSVFIFSYISNYSRNYIPFIFDLNDYGNYIQRLKTLLPVNYQIRPKEVKKKGLEVTPLINKFRRLRILEGKKKNLLFGYKFHFSGRFTRKQKAASLWYTKGALPVSSMSYDVEYGFYTIPLRYSACTLKVWLYKNKRITPKYGYRLV